MNKLSVSAIVIVVSSITSPALATEELTPEPTQSYRVIDVAEDDVLNIRQQPDAGSDIVGTLPSDADRIVVAGTRVRLNGSVWWQVAGEDGLGWVNARYLSPDGEPPLETEPFPLRCTGTEPFWTLSIGGTEATFRTPLEEDAVWTAGPLTTAVGLVGRYAARLEDGDGVGHVAAWRNQHFCSDSMSDIGFPYEAMVIAPDGTVYGGCCLRSGE